MYHHSQRDLGDRVFRSLLLFSLDKAAASNFADIDLQLVSEILKIKIKPIIGCETSPFWSTLFWQFFGP